MDIPFSFPVSVGDFLAYQEELAGCKLSEDTRETIAAWVPVINGAYLDGMDDADRAMMDGLIKRHSADSAVALFLEKAKLWMEYAAEQRTKA